MYCLYNELHVVLDSFKPVIRVVSTTLLTVPQKQKEKLDLKAIFFIMYEYFAASA